MSDDLVKRLRDARKWFNNDGQCCGQVDSVGTCAAPACIFGEALKEFSQTADRIEKQAAEITRLRAALATARREGMEEAAKEADAIARRFRIELPEKWKARPGGIPKDWMDTWEYCAETAEESAAAIRAAAKEEK